jgi:Sulfotransferase family
MPLYRHGSKIVFFIHVPKTGGSSVENALRSLGCKQALFTKGKPKFFRANLQHVNSEVYNHMMDDDFYDYAFMVVRNPFDRAASEFKMKVIDAEDTTPFDEWFPAAIERCKQFRFTRDNHIRPQSSFFSEGVEVFKVEDGLDKVLAAACNALGIEPPATPRHDRKGSEGLIEAKSSTLTQLAAFYSKDFSHFGYPIDHSKSFKVVE